MKVDFFIAFSDKLDQNKSLLEQNFRKLLDRSDAWPRLDTDGSLIVGLGNDVYLRLSETGVVVGDNVALATTATEGFLYVPSCAGTPTGVPTAVTGKIPLIVDSTNNKLYFYSGGAWRDAGP